MASKVIKPIAIFGIALIAMLATRSAIAEQRTLSGSLNEMAQFVSTTGRIYEIADTEAGEELINEVFDEKIVIFGDVVEDDEVAILSVESYKILSAPDAQDADSTVEEAADASSGHPED